MVSRKKRSRIPSILVAAVIEKPSFHYIPDVSMSTKILSHRSSFYFDSNRYEGINRHSCLIHFY
jgi:hypothetical protein